MLLECERAKLEARSLLTLKHRHAVLEICCLPEGDHDIYDSQPGHGAAKPGRGNGTLNNGKAGFIGDKRKKIVLRPVAEEHVPRSKDEIRPQKQAKYNEKNDVLRVTAPVSQLNESLESFSILFEKKGEKQGVMKLGWDKTVVEVPFSY